MRRGRLRGRASLRSCGRGADVRRGRACDAARAARARRPDRRRSAQALRPPDRRRPAAHPGTGARARAPQGPGRRGCEAQADRVEPAARHVHHAQLHARRRTAARSHPGREPRPHPRGREVRLHDGLQALDVRDLVDQAGDLARARRAGAHDPAPGPRRRPGPQGHEDTAPARPEAQSRSVARRDRRRDRDHARARPGAARARFSTP